MSKPIDDARRALMGWEGFGPDDEDAPANNGVIGPNGEAPWRTPPPPPARPADTARAALVSGNPPAPRQPAVWTGAPRVQLGDHPSSTFLFHADVIAQPVPECVVYWRDGWPQRTCPDSPHRGLAFELGARAYGALAVRR